MESISHFVPIVEAVTQVYSEDDLQDTIHSVFSLSAMDATYILVESKAFDEDYWQLTWVKKYGDLENPYESVKIVVNRYTGELVLYKKFDEAPNTFFPEITVTQAMESISGWLEQMQVAQEDVEYQIEFAKANYEQETNSVIGQYGDVRMTYKFSFVDGMYSIYVDACTGECIAFSQRRDAARAFSVGQAPAFPDPTTQTLMARSCFLRLGYTSIVPLVSDDDSTLANAIKTFISQSDAYGLYIAAHGDEAQTKLTDNYRDTILRVEEVYGNWKFVFLDACYSAAGTGWSSRFNITDSSTDRAFLGWYDTVYGNYSVEFTDYFFPEVINGAHSNKIRDAAVWAASQVEGAGTTPIRFYGDRTYNGVV